MENEPKWAISGMGRIGRAVFARNEALRQQPSPGEGSRIRPVCIDTLYEPIKPLDQVIAEIRHDFVHGAFPINFGVVKTLNPNELVLKFDDGREVVMRGSDLRDTWKEENIFGVIDSSGANTTRQKAASHLFNTYVNHVIVTSPMEDADLSMVVGVNEDNFAGQQVISDETCTTKSVVPPLQALLRSAKLGGIRYVDVKTIHAATGGDLAVLRKRAEDYATDHDMDFSEAAFHPEEMPDYFKQVDWINYHPTGAAKAVARLLPGLAGKFHGEAMRVNSPNGSVSLMTVEIIGRTTAEEVNRILAVTAERLPPGVMRVVDDMKSTQELDKYLESAVVIASKTRVGPDGKVIHLEVGYNNEAGGPAQSPIATAGYIEDWHRRKSAA